MKGEDKKVGCWSSCIHDFFFSSSSSISESCLECDDVDEWGGGGVGVGDGDAPRLLRLVCDSNELRFDLLLGVLVGAEV